MTSTVIGNANLVEVLSSKLKRSISSNKPYIGLVIGPSRGGKTTICMSIFKMLNMDVITINNDITNVKDLAKVLEPHRDTFTISSFFSCKPKVVFLDDFDVYGQDKPIQTYMTSFIKHPNFESAPMRVIISISNTSEKGMILLSKKMDDVLRIHNPSPDITYDYIISLKEYNDVPKQQIHDLCHKFDGNVGSILSHLKVLGDCIDSTAVAIKDKTQQEIMEMVCKQDQLMSTDVLLMYDAKMISMTYFDNIKKIAKPAYLFAEKKAASKIFADIHMFDEKMYNNEVGVSMAIDLWCSGLMYIARSKNKSKSLSGSIIPTKILNRTSTRYLLNKRIYNFMSNAGVDQNSREVVFDVMSNHVLIYGKSCVDKEAYLLCREYLQTVGDIQKEYIDQLDI